MGTVRADFVMQWTDTPPCAEHLLRELVEALMATDFIDNKSWKFTWYEDRANLAQCDTCVCRTLPQDFWKQRSALAPFRTYTIRSEASFPGTPAQVCEVEVFDEAVCNQSLDMDTIRKPAAIVSFPLHRFVFPREIIEVENPNLSLVEECSQRMDSLAMSLRELVRAGRPSAAYLTSTSCGLAYPYNSFLNYYANTEEVIRDIRWLESRWNEPARTNSGRVWCEALRDTPADSVSRVFSELRNPSQREKLKSALSERFPLNCAVSDENVRSVLSEKSTDVFRNWAFERAGDFAVCIYPAILNNFIDSFYLRVIDAARAASLTSST